GGAAHRARRQPGRLDLRSHAGTGLRAGDRPRQPRRGARRRERPQRLPRPRRAGRRGSARRRPGPGHRATRRRRSARGALTMAATVATNGQAPVMLAARNVSAGYHGVPVVHHLELEVRAGEVVLLAGPNGAGKTTTMMTLAGALRPLGGSTEFAGAVTTLPMHRCVRLGLGVVTECRSIFSRLTVAENLRLGRGAPEAALAHFPELRARLNIRAGQLSGG